MEQTFYKFSVTGLFESELKGQNGYRIYIVNSEGKDKISQTDFELHNDGGSIRSSCWEVTWYEDYVEVILSGEEQLDERITLYFDGSVDMQQITEGDDDYVTVEEAINTTNRNDNIFAEVHFERCTPAFLLFPHHYFSVAFHAIEPEIASFL